MKRNQFRSTASLGRRWHCFSFNFEDWHNFVVVLLAFSLVPVCRSRLQQHCPPGERGECFCVSEKLRRLWAVCSVAKNNGRDKTKLAAVESVLLWSFN